MNQYSNKYDLENRTADFGLAVIKLCHSIRQDAISRPIISQIVRSATSIGANYCEANGASSKKDFTNKIYICRKESQETRHWLKMVEGLNLGLSDDLKLLQDECRQLILIFQKIGTSLAEKKIEELNIN